MPTKPPVKFIFTAWAKYDPQGPKYDPKFHQYLLSGYEKCPDTGEMHWQSYVEFKRESMPKDYVEKAKTLGLTNKLKFKPAKGTAAENKTYTHKDKTRLIEEGTPIIAGQRTDLQGVCDSIVSGAKTTDDIMLENSDLWCRNYRALGILEKKIKIKEPQTRNCKFIYIHGSTGIGKTTLARKLSNGPYYEAPTHTRYWNKYEGQQTIIVNEVTPELFNAYNILWWNNVIDNTKVEIDIKYGSIPCCATTFIFTSNSSLQDLLLYVKPEQAKAFTSRVTRLIKAIGTDKRRRNDPVQEEVIDLD